MNPEDWGGAIYLVLLGIPVLMLLNAANKIGAMQRDQRRADRRSRSKRAHR